MNKPIKPDITIPQSFAENGVKTDFDDTLLTDGFDNLRPDVLAGDNLNKFIDDTYKGLNYGMAAADAINLINEGETLTVKDGKLSSGSVGGDFVKKSGDTMTGALNVPTPTIGDNSTKVATTAFVNTVLPAGTIVSSGSSSTPTGYLYCNGSAVSRTTYAKLFDAIGTTYGAGDGSKTFNLPNFTNYKFVTSATVSVKGNGKAIGITDGTNNYGLGSGTAFLTAPRTQNYGQDVGVSLGATAKNFDSTIGLTTEASKSGITATASTATIKWYIKY